MQDPEQSQTFASIGEFVVAVGQLEAALGRTREFLLHNERRAGISPETRKLTWATLPADVSRAAHVAGWGEEIDAWFSEFQLQQVVKLRHTLLHGEVQVRGANIWVQRRPNRGQDHTMVAKRDDIVSFTQRVAELTSRLQALHGGTLDRPLDSSF